MAPSARCAGRCIGRSDGWRRASQSRSSRISSAGGGCRRRPPSFRRRPQPGARHRDRAHAALDGPRRGRGRRPRPPPPIAGWSETPPVVRARAMFRFKALLEEHFEELARLVTTEHGKTLDESRGSVRRGIECVEVACGGPSMLMGYGLENVAPGIDCTVMRQPIGVCAAIAPFNFPAMVPLWFLPFAVACGNTFVLKPSEQVPLSQARMFELLAAVRPAARRRQPGARRQGGRRGDLRSPGHPRRVVRRLDAGGAAGLPARDARRQARAGAGRREELRHRDARRRPRPGDPDHHRVVLRLRRASGAWPAACWCRSGEAHSRARDRLVEAAAALKVGDGLEPGVDMGPVISAAASRSACWATSSVASAKARGSSLDGRDAAWPTGPTGYFVGPSVFDEVTPGHGHRPRRDLRPRRDGRVRSRISTRPSA